jgi:hypothetical protein
MSCSVWSALSFCRLPKRCLARLSRNNSDGSTTEGTSRSSALVILVQFHDVIDVGTHRGEAAPIIAGGFPVRGGYSDCGAPRCDLEAANGWTPCSLGLLLHVQCVWWTRSRLAQRTRAVRRRHGKAQPQWLQHPPCSPKLSCLSWTHD